jgi:hypothetical protein
MRPFTSSLSRMLVGSVAAATMALTSASPVFARDHGHDGIGAGEVIAGALVIGGIAAVAAAASNNDRGRYGSRYDDDYRYGGDYRYDRAGYGYGQGGSRRAVETCVRAAERDASRGVRGRADVTQVTSIDRFRGGFAVRGRIAVDDRGRGWDRRDSGWGRDGRDTGRFSCEVRHGRIAHLDFSGIRGLR